MCLCPHPLIIWDPLCKILIYIDICLCLLNNGFLKNSSPSWSHKFSFMSSDCPSFFSSITADESTPWSTQFSFNSSLLMWRIVVNSSWPTAQLGVITQVSWAVNHDGSGWGSWWLPWFDLLKWALLEVFRRCFHFLEERGESQSVQQYIYMLIT